jgi:hypothetical protein
MAPCYKPDAANPLSSNWLIAKKFHANGAHSHGVEVVSDVRGEASGGGKELRNNFERAVTRPDAALHVAGVFGPFGCKTREVIIRSRSPMTTPSIAPKLCRRSSPARGSTSTGP